MQNTKCYINMFTYLNKLYMVIALTVNINASKHHSSNRNTLNRDTLKNSELGSDLYITITLSARKINSQDHSSNVIHRTPNYFDGLC